MKAKLALALTAFSFLIATFGLSGHVDAAIITVCASSCTATTVQGGINAASNGDIVRITDSRYYNENLIIDKGVFLTSTGSSKPTIWANSGVITINLTSNHTYLSNLNIIYNGTDTSGRTIGSVVPIENITIANSTVNRTGYVVAGSPNVGTIYFPFSSVNLDTKNNIRISNNSIAFDLFNGTVGGAGVRLFTDCQGNLIHNNTVFINTSGSSFGISIDPCTYTNVTQNIIILAYSGSSSKTGIHSGNNGATNNIVTGNRIYVGSVGNGMQFSNQWLHSLIAWNTIMPLGANGNYAGISFGSTSAYNNITGNIVYTNVLTLSRNGLTLGANNTARNNTIYVTNYGTAFAYGVEIIGSNNTLENNTITGNNTNTGGVRLSNVRNVEFRDSTISATHDVNLAGTGANNYATFVNVDFDSSYVNITNGNTAQKLYVQHYLDARVLDSSNNPVSGAALFGNDTNSVANIENPTSNFSASTNSSGYIPRQILTEFMVNGTYNSSSGYLYFAPYTINGTTQTDLTGNTAITLGGAAFSTLLGGPSSATWGSVAAGVLVRSGTPYDWTWRVYEAGSGRKVPQGTPYSWTWGSE